MNSATFHQIRNLILLIGSAVLLAIVVGIYFIFNFSPSGQYQAKNTMLAPDILQKLNFSDINSKSGRDSQFVFDSIEFIWNEKKMQVDVEKYAKIYELLSSDNSLRSVSEYIENLFSQPPPARLVISVKTESEASWQVTKKIFQEVQFVPKGDYYKVELHEQNSKQGWAYYIHPKVYEKVIAILVPNL